MEVTSDDSWQATSQSLSKVLSKFPQEVTKTRNFTSVLDLATSAVAATHLCQDLAKGRKLLLSLPEDSIGSHSTGHSTATAPLGHLYAIPTSHTSTQKEHSFTPLEGFPLKKSVRPNSSCSSPPPPTAQLNPAQHQKPLTWGQLM